MDGGRPGELVDIGPLEGSLGFLLRLAQLQAFDRFDAAMGQPGVTPGGFTVLLVIGMNPGVRQGALAERLSIKRAAMTKIARALEKRGLIARAVPPHDRRTVALSLTGAGAAFLAERRARFAAHEAEAAPGLSPAEGRQLVGLLQKLVRAEGEDAP